MTTSRSASRTFRAKKYTCDLGNGIKLRAQVSPCVFMYEGYPLQITIALIRGRKSFGEAYAVDRAKTALTFAAADVNKLLKRVQIQPCARCSAPAFNPDSVQTNRGGLCESCFLSDIEAELAIAMEAELRKVAARDRSMKAKGMKVRLTAWIHPHSGDDYQSDWYFRRRPNSTEVRKLLSKKGSCQLDDYEVITL